MIGFSHGDEEKENALPLIFAGDFPKMWGESKCREVHCGHLHKRKEIYFVGSDTFNGAVVRRLPSLSGRDKWHYDKGYLGIRAADSYLWSKSDGFAGMFPANVRE
jgi:hypothetical protein